MQKESLNETKVILGSVIPAPGVGCAGPPPDHMVPNLSESGFDEFILQVDGSSQNPDIETDMASLMLEYFELFKRKQHDYGPGNIAQFGEFGCLVRASDKVQRLKNLLDKGEGNAVPGEVLRDSWLDLIGYGLIGLLCHQGSWPGVAATSGPGLEDEEEYPEFAFGSDGQGGLHRADLLDEVSRPEPSAESPE